MASGLAERLFAWQSRAHTTDAYAGKEPTSAAPERQIPDRLPWQPPVPCMRSCAACGLLQAAGLWHTALHDPLSVSQHHTWISRCFPLCQRPVAPFRAKGSRLMTDTSSARIRSDDPAPTSSLRLHADTMPWTWNGGTWDECKGFRHPSSLYHWREGDTLGLILTR